MSYKPSWNCPNTVPVNIVMNRSGGKPFKKRLSTRYAQQQRSGRKPVDGVVTGSQNATSGVPNAPEHRPPANQQPSSHLARNNNVPNAPIFDVQRFATRNPSISISPVPRNLTSEDSLPGRQLSPAIQSTPSRSPNANPVASLIPRPHDPTTPQMVIDLSDDDNDDNEMSSIAPEKSSKEESTACSSSNAQTSQFVSIYNEAGVLTSELLNVFEKIQHYLDTYESVHDKDEILARSYIVFKYIKNASGNLQDLKKNIAEMNSLKMELKQGPKEVPVGIKYNKKTDVNDKENYNKKFKGSEDKQVKTPKTRRSNTIDKLPAFNLIDTKWTLKYRTNGPDLVELVPSSDVYVNANKLKRFLQIAQNPTALARMILTEVFSDLALRVCTVKGARRNAIDMNGAHVKLGLDEPALSYIVGYVTWISWHKAWKPVNEQTIMKSLLNKIQVIKAQHRRERQAEPQKKRKNA